MIGFLYEFLSVFGKGSFQIHSGLELKSVGVERDGFRVLGSGDLKQGSGRCNLKPAVEN